MNASVSVASPALGMAIVPGLATSCACVAIVNGVPWLGSPTPEKEEADYRSDCDQHANSNEHIVHATRPQMLQSHPYSEKVS